MPLWTQTTPPVWAPTAVATPAGWADPVTGELLVAIRELAAKGVDILDVPTFTAALSAAAYLVGDTFRVLVTASEPVRVTAAVTVPVAFTGNARSAVYNPADSTPTVHAFDYVLTAADISIAGEVVVTAEMIGGQVKDLLPGEGTHLVAQVDRIFPAVDATLVTVSAV